MLDEEKAGRQYRHAIKAGREAKGKEGIEKVERAIRNKLLSELLQTLERIGKRHPGDPGETDEQLLRRAAKEGDKEAQQVLIEWGDLTLK